MPAWICRTCGVQYPESGQPPAACPICLDERQYVGWGGQQWTTMAELASDRAVVLREEEPDLIGVGVEPSFAIGQRALLVRTPHGNVLWDCVSLLDDAARQRITELGGIGADLHVAPALLRGERGVRRRLRRPGSSSRAPTSSGCSGPRRASSSSTTRPSRCPGSPWPGSAGTSTARPCCTGRPGRKAAARCSPGTPSPWCRTGTGSASCGATPT